ncbi:MAG TPA: hypothetical protein VFT21_06950 [Gemmatimonadaceae bacterium]|nr:hypothetical protein [Gemmatimonadaceae bacterium]
MLEADYAACYLGSAKLASLSVLHYLTIGERLGSRPNPFFDPHYFAKASGGSHHSLLEYLDHYASGDVSPSREFEHSWYTWQNPDWCRNYEHPFLHFYFEGLAQGRDPAPGIDIWKFLRNLPSSGNAMRHLYSQVTRRGRFDSSFSLYSTEDLRRAQDAFKESIELDVHCENPRGSRRFLVFVQASRAVASSFLYEERDFDILLNFYDGLPVADWPGVEHLVSQRGTKSSAVAKLLEARPDLLLRYDAVLFLDDDIVLSAPAVSRFFAEMERSSLDLAQPSLTAESSCVWPVLKQPAVGPGVRLTNAVEIMMPAATRFTLERAGWAFGRAISGYGVDLLLGHEIVDRLGRKAGVIGAVVASHEKPIDSRKGDFYTFMRSLGIKPKHELWTIMKEFGIEATFEYRD